MDYISLIIGLVLGAIIGYIVHPRGTSNEKIKTAQLEALLSQQKTDIENLRNQNKQLVAEAAAREREVKTLTDVRKNMLNDFKVVSAELIEQQKKSVVGTQKTVLEPMQREMKTLKDGFDSRITEMLKTAAASKSSIDEQIKNMMSSSENLQKEASNLANALRNKKTQGCWGETYLENVLQMMGFVEGVDYNKEVFYSNEDGNIRPDFIVNLPNNRKIIIDSKVSLDSYINYENADSDSEREKYATEFLRATEKHINELGDKDYQKKVKNSGLDYVFMFMPLESAYILAMQRKPELYASAQQKNVALITSSLLFPILKTVDMLLKLDRQNKNIAEVVDLVNKLYEKYVGFTENFKNVGKNIDTAQKAYNDALGQLTTGRGNMSSYFAKIKQQSGLTTNKNIALEYKDE